MARELSGRGTMRRRIKGPRNVGETSADMVNGGASGVIMSFGREIRRGKIQSADKWYTRISSKIIFRVVWDTLGNCEENSISFEIKLRDCRTTAEEK